MNPRFSQIRAQSYTKKPKLQRFRLFNYFNYCFLMFYTVFPRVSPWKSNDLHLKGNDYAIFPVFNSLCRKL